jgi:hypothetical protein
MGNLGKYQDLVTQAARLGGVDNLIKKIEAGAVTKAAPKLVALGVGVGALLVVGGKAAMTGGKNFAGKYRARQVAADEAKKELKAEVARALDSDATIADPGAGSGDVDEANPL